MRGWGSNPADLETSLVYFEQTSKIDPKFAPAYSGMAGVWLGRMQMGLVPPKEAVPRIEENITSENFNTHWARRACKK